MKLQETPITSCTWFVVFSGPGSGGSLLRQMGMVSHYGSVYEYFVEVSKNCWLLFAHVSLIWCFSGFSWLMQVRWGLITNMHFFFRVFLSCWNVYLTQFESYSLRPFQWRLVTRWSEDGYSSRSRNYVLGCSFTDATDCMRMNRRDIRFLLFANTPSLFTRNLTVERSKLWFHRP
jgi:hypothetical protein